MVLLKTTCDSSIKFAIERKGLYKTAVANTTSNNCSTIMEQTTVIKFDRNNVFLVDFIPQVTWQQLENSKIYRFEFKK